MHEVPTNYVRSSTTVAVRGLSVGGDSLEGRKAGATSVARPKPFCGDGALGAKAQANIPTDTRDGKTPNALGSPKEMTRVAANFPDELGGSSARV